MSELGSVTEWGSLMELDIVAKRKRKTFKASLESTPMSDTNPRPNYKRYAI